MKYVFFGSPRFAAIILQKLLDAGIPPVTLVANPDRPVGRKQIMTSPQTKQIALAQRLSPIPFLQPEAFDSALAENLTVLMPDFFVVAAYARIIPSSILEIPRLGTLGVHPSLLPKYRGSSPIQTVLLNGDRETGATIYAMDAKMDHGPIIAQENVAVDENENYLALEEKLATIGGSLLIKTIPEFFAGKTTPQPQDETQASYTQKFKTEDAFVDEKDLDVATAGNTAKSIAILRKINAFNPEPGAWTVRGSRRMKLLGAKIDEDRLVLTKIQNDGEQPRDL